MVVAVVDDGPKAVGSTAGMERSRATSPLYRGWLARSPERVERAERAILDCDLATLGEIMEASTFEMHACMHTSLPPLMYWRPRTVAALNTVFELRNRGIGAWATMDAGPQVKVLCQAGDADAVAQALQPVAQRVEVLAPARGAHLVEP
jgi:diphosphomevalonate decarboxylase